MAEYQQREQRATALCEKFAAERADHWSDVEDAVFRNVITIKSQIAAGAEQDLTEREIRLETI